MGFDGVPMRHTPVAAVPVPEPTENYHPVPYSRFVEEVELQVPRVDWYRNCGPTAVERKPPYAGMGSTGAANA